MDCENREAIYEDGELIREATTEESSVVQKVRRQWMGLMGCDESEINEACNSAFDLSLEDELLQLAAAIRLTR